MSAGSGLGWWASIATAGALAGGVVGATALRRGGEPVEAVTLQGVAQIAVYDCPDGTETGALSGGDRVFAVGRDASATWLAIRDPRDVRATVWLRASAATQDRVVELAEVPCDPPAQVDAAVEGSTPPDTAVTDSTTTSTLPTATTVTGTNPPPTNPPPTNPPPTNPPPPTTVPDTTPPTLSAPVKSHAGSVCVPNQSGFADRVNITVTITDAGSSVVSATGLYNGQQGGANLPGSFTLTLGAKNKWTGTFGPFASVPSGYSQTIQVRVRAVDAAGNVGVSSTVGVTVVNAGDCLG